MKRGYPVVPRLDNIVNIFHIKPPLVIRMVLVQPKKTSGSDSDSLSQARVHDHAAYQVVRPGWRIGPRATLDAAVAHSALSVGEIEAGTAEFVSWDVVCESIGYVDERTAEEKELQHKQFERIAAENEKIYEMLLSL